MSRIGKLPIKVPQNVNIVLEAEQITVKGPMGTLTQVIPNDISITFEQDLITINKLNENISAREKYGLTRSLVQNMVTGVSTRFEKKLQMIGVGYRAQVNGKELNLNVGFSHPVVFNIPEGIEIIVEANTNLIIRGADKEAVGLLASRIRAIRPPEPYKGKGIRYTNEVVLRKAGKSGKK
jgi:large subunit ribosomal protein L6